MDGLSSLVRVEEAVVCKNYIHKTTVGRYYTQNKKIIMKLVNKCLCSVCVAVSLPLIKIINK